MDARLLVRSKFMVSHEFGSGDIPREPLVTIADVTKPGELDETTKDWWLISFVEAWAKPLKVNRTHQQALILMFGGDTDGWKGKRIGLYPLAGTFFGRRQTAVRIKGSPDIKSPCSFQVRKFGGGKDTYNLVVMPAPGTAPSSGKAALPEWITFGVGAKERKKIVELLDEALDESIALAEKNLSEIPPGTTPPWKANIDAQLAALKAERAMREEVRAASLPPGAERATDTPPF